MTSRPPRPFDVLRVPFAYEDKPGVFKERPAVVASVDGESAVLTLVKVTGHGPRPEFPGEVRLADWAAAGLTKPSTVRCSKAIRVALDEFPTSQFVGSLTRRDADAVLGGLLDAGTVEPFQGEAQKRHAPDSLKRQHR